MKDWTGHDVYFELKGNIIVSAVLNTGEAGDINGLNFSLMVIFSHPEKSFFGLLSQSCNCFSKLKLKYDL